MTSKTTTKATSPKASKKSSEQQSRTKHSRRKSNRINRQRRLQKQLQILILERHSRRCIICHHPDREAIEEEFVHWRAPWKLSQDYELADYRTVYRHARAVGLLLQRRERLHSALDAFVESVDDVTFTGDTILRAMRAYSCIDDHGRWTEIPTQVQFSTSHDGRPPQPSPRSSNVASDVIDINPREETEEDAENAPEERVTAFDVLEVVRKYANQAPRSEATAPSASSKSTPRRSATFCAGSPAQASNAPEDEYDELEDEDSDADEEPEDDAEDDAEIELEEAVASVSISSKSVSHSDTPTCAAPPAQSVVPLTSNDGGRTVTATACADSPAQAVPRDVVRGQNPSDRSLSDRTASAARPRNRLPLQDPSPTPTASSGTRARATPIRRCQSRTRRAASCTKST